MDWRCVACAHDTFRSRGRQDAWQLRQCASCGAVAAHPTPTEDEIAQIYADYSVTPEYQAKAASKLRRARGAYAACGAGSPGGASSTRAATWG